MEDKGKMITSKTITALLTLLVIAGLAIAPVLAHGGDIGIEVENGKLAVGLVDHDDEFVPGVRVFGSEIEELVVGPVTLYITEDPGFDGEPGTFPVPCAVGFDILASLGAWTGSGFTFGIDETLTIAHTDSGQQVTTGSGAVSGFTLPVAADGSWHRHFTFTLNGSAGAPADGIYLLELALKGGEAADSDPFWIVFNKNMEESDHEAAVDWVNENYVPEPSALAGMGVGLLGLASLRRYPRGIGRR